MDTTSAQRGTRRMPTRYQSVSEEEMLNEGEYDDMWPSRQPSSARRYQGVADIRTESGRAADVQSLAGKRSYLSLAGERHTIPARRTATQGRMPAVQTTPSARVYIDDEQARTRNTEDPRKARPTSHRRFHWSVFVGLALLTMIFGWVALGALGNWWQTTTNDWRYGRPRTFQIDQVVGHHDSSQNPSHFIAMNLNRHVVIIEIPGGDVSKSVVFNGPTLLGSGGDLAPVTLSFQDVNHDGKLDMIVSVQGSQFVFLNENGTFVPPSQIQNGNG